MRAALLDRARRGRSESPILVSIGAKGESYGWYRVVVGGRSVEPEGEGSMNFALPMSSIGTMEVGPFDRAR